MKHPRPLQRWPGSTFARTCLPPSATPWVATRNCCKRCASAVRGNRRWHIAVRNKEENCRMCAVLNHLIFHENSQRPQEFDESFLVLALHFFKLRGYVFCFACVAQNGIAKSHRSAVVHQSRTQAHAPQRRGADPIAAAFKVLFRHIVRPQSKNSFSVLFRNRLQNSVASANIVHQKIPVRMECDGAERGRNRERSAINFCSGGRSV